MAASKHGITALMRLLGVLLLTYCFQVFGSSVSIPLSSKDLSKRPPDDLVYQQARIDSYQALKLIQKGVDISTLNPYESHLWQDTSHSLEPLELSDLEFQFSEYKRSPTEFFRAVVTQKGKRYVMTASLDNHTNILRAALLRKLGYDVALPQFFPELSVSFPDRDAKDAFLKTLGEETLTRRERWLARHSSDTTLHLRDVTIEKAELKNVNIHLPVMSRERQKQRRVFRALLAIYKITDFPQSINRIASKVGRSFNHFLLLTHPYANQFQDVAKEDLLWIIKRINTALNRADFQEIVSLAGYPSDIAELIIEKLLARVNSLAQHLQSAAAYQPQLNLSQGRIQNGKLISPVPYRVVEYFNENADSPYEYRELFRLFRTQATYNALSEVLSFAVERLIPAVRIENAITNIQDNIQTYRQQHGNNTGSIPLEVSSFPTAFVNASARRNVVFGQYMENVAPIQLVDTVSAEANLGVYTMLDSLASKITPNVSAGVSLSRTYSHVRAMPDLASATNQEIKKILVPRLMKTVGRIIQQEFACSLIDTITVQESILNGQVVFYIKFDTAIPNAITIARERREQLIAAGTEAEKILLIPVKKKQVCEAELEQQKTKSLEEFLKELADQETFIIADSINLNGTANAALPLEPLLGQPLSLSLGSHSLKGFLQAMLIRKKPGYIEVSLQRQNNFHNSLSLGLNYFIEIMRGTKKWLQGEQETKIYKIPTTDLDPGQREIVLNTIRELFVSQHTYLLEEHFDPIVLDHSVQGVLNTLQVLWYKAESLVMDHFLTLQLPQRDYPDLPLAERRKTLFSTSSIRRNGKNILDFFNRALGSLSRFFNLGSGNADPGRNYGGNSKSRYYVTEADISEEQDHTTTKIDYIWRGWSANQATLYAIFDFIESLYDETQVDYHIDRTRFNNSGPLKSYEVKSTLIVYPQFLEKFKTQILQAPAEEAVKTMIYLYGEKKWRSHCNLKPANYRQRWRRCFPLGAKKFMRMRSQGLPLEKVARTKAFNSILLTLLEGFDRKRVLAWMGEKNFFASTRVTGFLENSEWGYLDYRSNTFGQYQTDYGTGVFDKIASLLGITPYEMRALNYTPGM